MAAKTIEVLVYEPGRKPFVKTIEATLTSYQKLVGGFIQPVELVPGVTLWANEEGILKGLEPNVLAVTEGGYRHPILGTCFVAGEVETEDGPEIGSLTKEEAELWSNLPRAAVL